MKGIIVAMERELAGWLDVVAVREIVRIADKTFYLASSGGVEVVLARSGIGKANAAMTAALLLSRFDVDAVINTGVAGGLRPTRPGDLVVATRVLFGDVDVRLIDPELPYGQIPGDPLYAPADPVLLERAQRILSGRHERFHMGAIVSADRFTTDRRQLADVLVHTPDIIACDMESMAVAATAMKFGTPFIILRGVSDVIDAPGQIDVYHDVVDDVCHRTAAFVAAFLQA